ncbi:hypothetical protein [Streptomyces sp. DH7]|uniref:hypothetical protein n=1 Tax=Streptomyces sp. DH7 TaxID=2857006 RepID=UPI001E4C70E1|nr:hypothetical protein [Streptomyces sp. DH7]
MSHNERTLCQVRDGHPNHDPPSRPAAPLRPHRTYATTTFTQHFDEPAWEHEETVWKYGDNVGDNNDDVLEDVELTVRTAPLILLGYLVTWCNERDEVVRRRLSGDR